MLQEIQIKTLNEGKEQTVMVVRQGKKLVTITCAFKGKGKSLDKSLAEAIALKGSPQP